MAKTSKPVGDGEPVVDPAVNEVTPAVEVPPVPAPVPADVPTPEPATTLEIVSCRDGLPCGDRVLAIHEKIATITLEPGVNLGFVVRAIQDSLAGVKPPA